MKELDGYCFLESGEIMKNGKLIKQTLCRRTGYMVFEFHKKTTRSHRMIAKAFYGECPKGFQVNHKNGIKIDNRPVNLEYVTASENIRHAYRTGLKKGKRTSTIPEATLIEIRKMLSDGKSQDSIAKKFSISQSTISLIKSGKRNRYKELL